MQSLKSHITAPDGRLSVALCHLPHSHGLPLPSYATELSAGMDLLAAIEDDIIIQPGKRELVPTGIAIALPQGFEAQVRARSGLSLKHGLAVLNAPGTIDADYRGEIKVILINLGQEPVTLTRGMRCAQLVVASHSTVTWDVVSDLNETDRGHHGFGSTGTNTK